ncbi:MAG TPA: LysM peptidoglycan-binding domain-containing protein [Marmoricola sp.]|jgi:hypothetical protein|nr:LysM peptidoglycan-binding domain-containing protein [Nocardioidaceae bacterium]MCO5323849.1 LysM peptidoglycan-binding domain-containing protein [Nocardioidaceae bacterium]HMU36571.1 LysM peptidoglycan-binding domain-containing protein [Marmoricola sp.]HRV69692.1 LysM peptidoglycan-binding domain-containing protein [Marmoricola sp.]
MIEMRVRGLLLAAMSLALPWLCFLVTDGSRKLQHPGAFTSYLVCGAAWLLVLCALWASALLIAVLLEEFSGHRLQMTQLVTIGGGCPALVRRFVIAWCGLALSAGLATSAQAATTPPGPAPLPSIGRVVDLPQQSVRVAPAMTPIRLRHQARTHITVMPGDSLWDLAQRHLGDGRRWPELHRVNRHLIHDPDLISPGWRLRLPGAPAASETVNGRGK